MKIDLLLRRAPAGIVAVAFLVLITPMAFAQANRNVQDRLQPVVTQVTFAINITDGMLDRNGRKEEATLEKVIELVREGHPGANIVLSPRLPVIRISNLKLRATGVEQELEALRVASGYKFDWGNASPPTAPAIDPTTGLPVDPEAGQAYPLYILSEPANSPDRRVVEVFNLSAYIERLDGQDNKDVDGSLQELEKIIAATMRDQGHGSTEELPRFTFHSGAKLLIVTGSEAAMDVARKVIGAVGGETALPARGTSRNFNGGGFSGGSAGALFGPAPQVPMSKARRSINNKLESIRLDSIAFDGLPLSDVVRRLREVAKQRDPEKQGINILINPNRPARDGQRAASPEVDINSISIRLDPGLNNVRLVDALDAIVKVADHPIQYSVMDFGVVISLKDPVMSGNFPGFSPPVAVPWVNP
jgi:hypothetical protein